MLTVLSGPLPALVGSSPLLFPLKLREGGLLRMDAIEK